MIVVVIIGLLAAIALPNFIKARETTQLNAIFENLRVLETVKEQYALEQFISSGTDVTIADMSDYLRSGAISTVAGEDYYPGKVGEESYALATTKVGPFPPNTEIKLSALPNFQ